jgi:hypothetical protein
MRTMTKNIKQTIHYIHVDSYNSILRACNITSKLGKLSTDETGARSLAHLHLKDTSQANIFAFRN